LVCQPENNQLEQATDAYTHPQPHACFIQSVDDDLVNDGGIMDLWTREARLFKYGSGTAPPISPNCAAKLNRSLAAANPPA